MNANGNEVEFRIKDDLVEMWVERDCSPFDDYVIGVMLRDDEGYFRFHPNAGVVMHCKLLRVAMQKITELNTM